MGIVNIGEVVGVRFRNGEIVCLEHLTHEEWENVTEDEIIHEDDLEGEDLCFCDRCREKLRSL